MPAQASPRLSFKVYKRAYLRRTRVSDQVGNALAPPHQVLDHPIKLILFAVQPLWWHLLARLIDHLFWKVNYAFQHGSNYSSEATAS
jgi:hypothetical protein